MRCRYIHDKKIGKVLIPGCMSVAHSGDILDCTCEKFGEPYTRFEKETYNEEVRRLRRIINELEEYVLTLKGGQSDGPK